MYDNDDNFEDLENEELVDRGDSLEDLEGEDEEDEELEDDGDSGDEESEEEEEEVASPKDTRIPKYRFDEVNNQRKELLAQLEDASERSLWLEAQLEKLISNNTKTAEPAAPANTYNFEAAEENYVQLIIEGEIAKASKLRAEIDKERRAELVSIISEVKSSASKTAKEESTKAVSEQRFFNTVEALEVQYPFLNNKVKDYNAEAVDTVNTLMAGFVAAGKSKADALTLAVKKVAPFYTKEVKAPSTKKEEAGRKAVAASKSQPPSPTGTKTKTIDISKIDVSKLAEKDFRSLTAKEKSVLRGD